MESKSVKDGMRLKGRIVKRVHDKEDLREACEDYDSLSKKEKMELAKEVESEERETVHNVTCDTLHEYFVDNLDPGNTSSDANITTLWMGLGTDGASGTSTSDTTLNNRTYEEVVTDVADNGKELLASTFVDSTEGNGNTFDEIGLFSGDPNDASTFILNHATFGATTKNNSKTVTFDVTLTFSDT